MPSVIICPAHATRPGLFQPDIAHYFAPKELPFTSLHFLEASVASLNV